MLHKRNEVLLPYTKQLAVVIAITLYFIYLLSRIGITEPINIFPIALSLNILLLPEVLRKIFRWHYGLAQVIALLVFVGLGWLGIIFERELSGVLIFILFANVLFLAFHGKRWDLKIKFRWLSLSIMILFALRLVGLIWDNNYLNPMAPESFSAATKFVHVDTLFLSSLTSFLETYKQTALGIYGLTDFNYHFGSNIVFASLSFLSSTSALEFYNFAYPVIFLPIFCESLLNASVDGRARLSTKHFVTISITLFFILGGFLSHRIESWYLLPSTINSHFISQSYGLSLTFTFIAITVYKPLIIDKELSVNNRHQIILLALIPVWFFIIGYTKLSTAVVMFGVLGYCLLRTKLLFKPLVFTAVVVSAITIYYVFLITVVRNEHTFFIQLGSYYKMFVEGNVFVYFLLNYMWLILFAVMTWLLRTRARINNYISQKNLLALEILLVTVVIGVIPGMLIHIPGGSAAYFSDIQYWLSAVAVLTIIPRFLDTIKFTRKGRLICAVVIAGLIIKDSLNKSVYNSWKRNLRIRSKLVFNDEEHLKKQMRKNYFNIELKNVLWALDDSPEYQTKVGKLNLPLLKKLDDLPLTMKSNSLIFCEDPQQLGTFLTCTEATFYLNAMTGIGMTNGLYWGKECYDIWEYGIQAFTEAPKDMTIEEATALTRQHKFLNLIVVNLERGTFVVKKVRPGSR
jgi:hypothetical protein